jgi:hypothetical protein
VGGLPKGEWGGDTGESLEAGAPNVKSGRVAAAVCGRTACEGGERVTLRFLVARRWFSDDHAGDGWLGAGCGGRAGKTKSGLGRSSTGPEFSRV